MSRSKYTIFRNILGVCSLWRAKKMKLAPFLIYFNDTKPQRPSRRIDEKLSKYWQPSGPPIDETLLEADQLYEQRKYIEVYEMLNRLNYKENCEVKWRIARVLYKTSTTCNNNLPLEIQREIIREAYELLLEEATEENRNANVHKWFAIICDRHHGFSSLENRVRSYHTVLNHLRIAFKLNPDDLTVCYLLGKLCFDMANLRGIRRFIARAMYAEPPSCTFEEAFEYLQRVEQLSGRKFLTGIYLLGKCCLELNKPHRAQHYFSMTCCMCPQTAYEYECLCDAKNHLGELEKYTLGREVLFPDGVGSRQTECGTENDD